MTDRAHLDRQTATTDCECPPQLCRHADGQREYPVWYLIDSNGQQVDSFDRHRDARKALRALLAERTPK